MISWRNIKYSASALLIASQLYADYARDTEIALQEPITKLSEQYVDNKHFEQKEAIETNSHLTKEQLNQKLISQYYSRVSWPKKFDLAVKVGTLASLVLAIYYRANIITVITNFLLDEKGRGRKLAKEAADKAFKEASQTLIKTYGVEEMFFRIYQTHEYSVLERCKNEYSSNNPIASRIDWLAPTILGSVSLYGIYKLIPTSYKALKKIIFPAADPIKNIRKQYISQKRFMPKDLQGAVEEKIGLADKDPVHADKVNAFVKHALSLPIQDAKVSFNEEQAKALLAFYDPTIIHQINQYCSTYIDNPEANARGIYLYGMPGTGKTRIAYLLGQILGLKVVKLSLAQMSMKDLFGERESTSTEAFPGHLAKALMQMEANNGILLLDDADRFLQVNPDAMPRFLALLDPESPSIYNDYFGVKLDMRKVIVVLTANNPVPDAALADRMWCMEALPYSTEAKVEMVEKVYIDETLNKSVYSNKEQIRQLIKSPEHQAELRAIIARDQSPGIRTLQKIVELYIRDLSNTIRNPNSRTTDWDSFFVQVNKNIEQNNRQYQ